MVTSGSQHATALSAFTVVYSTQPGHISYNLSVPSISRPGRIAYVTLTYNNDGGSDAPAPLFVVSVTSNNATIGLPGETNFSGSSVQILGIENTGPAGTLRPGYQGTIQIPYESTSLVQGDQIQFGLQVMTGDSTPIDWASMKSSLQPSYMTSTAWDAVFTNLTAQFGSTTATYLAALDNGATYLSELGEYTDDVQRLFGFAINNANDALTTGSIDSVTDASFPVPGTIPLVFARQFNASISGRDTIGPFGYGWTDNWQISASADAQGNVTIHDDGSLLYFAKNTDGSYTPSPGEYGTLTLASGAYQYVETNGTILAFNPNGSLNYEQDTNSNRITASYDANSHLTSLKESNGSTITIAYNAQGLISSITDPGGQTTSYAYDATGQQLLTFTDVFGKTTYTYDTGPTAADVNAMTSLTFADGTGIEWSYDAQGRLSTQAVSTVRARCRARDLRLSSSRRLPSPTPTATRRHLNDDRQLLLDHRPDGQHHPLLIRLPSTTSRRSSPPTARQRRSHYDANGNMTSETDPLGYTIHFTYNAFGEPLTFVNQIGYTTTYQYDASGNLLKTINPDGTTQHYVYDSLGEVTSSTDANGQTISYAYNPKRPAHGREPARWHVEYVHVRRATATCSPPTAPAATGHSPTTARTCLRGSSSPSARCSPVRYRRQHHANRGPNGVHDQLPIRRGRPAERADRRERQPDRVI